MRRVCCTLLTCIAICSGAGGVLREVTYDANNPLLPTFEKGYLLTAEAACTIAVYGPEGQPCSLLSAAADRDGSIAAAISYTSSAAYRAGILQLDRTGHKISFTDTGRYLPSHICFDRERSIWSIGWQRDGIQSDSEDSQDDPILRKYTAGRETGALLARSLWSRKFSPGAASGRHTVVPYEAAREESARRAGATPAMVNCMRAESLANPATSATL